MATGNFSNGGRDTFNPAKNWIGVRLQQGVPLLDRDWNEAEDIRRHYARTLRRQFIGEGAPDVDGFLIKAPATQIANDFVISPGWCMVDGYEVQNEREILYSQQPGSPILPDSAVADEWIVFLDTEIVRIGEEEDPSLGNPQDLRLETCLRDRLTWSVRVVRSPEIPPPDGYVLAVIRRPANTRFLTPAMIEDKRRAGLQLADAVDRIETLEVKNEQLTERVNTLQIELERVRQQLSRLFWDIAVTAPVGRHYFGASVPVTVTVLNGLGEPVSGALLSFSTDWGWVEPGSAATNKEGRVTVHVHGVESQTPPTRADIAVLNRAAARLNDARVADSDAIQYSLLRFEPDEMQLVSRYSHPYTFVDLARDLSDRPIVATPRTRTVTLTVHAREGQAAVVRGLGTVQIQFGHWVRDWSKSKIAEVVTSIQVGDRIGDLFRQGIRGETFEPVIVNAGLPSIFQAVNDEALTRLTQTALLGGGAGVSQLGSAGQTILAEATAAIGARTNQAIESRIVAFQNDPTIPEFNEPEAARARTAIGQTALQISAGFSQNAKQVANAAFAARKG
jgi:hypothetical protein